MVRLHSSSAEALVIIERQALRVGSIHSAAGPWYARPFGRLLRADLLFALGRHAEALGWYDGFPYMTPTSYFEMSYLSHIYGKMAQAYEALGDRERAIEYHARFIERWGDSDPALQHRVDAARASLAQLVERSPS